VSKVSTAPAAAPQAPVATGDIRVDAARRLAELEVELKGIAGYKGSNPAVAARLRTRTGEIAGDMAALQVALERAKASEPRPMTEGQAADRDAKATAAQQESDAYASYIKSQKDEKGRSYSVPANPAERKILFDRLREREKAALSVQTANEKGAATQARRDEAWAKRQAVREEKAAELNVTKDPRYLALKAKLDAAGRAEGDAQVQWMSYVRAGDKRADEADLVWSQLREARADAEIEMETFLRGLTPGAAAAPAKAESPAPTPAAPEPASRVAERLSRLRGN